MGSDGGWRASVNNVEGFLNVLMPASADDGYFRHRKRAQPAFALAVLTEEMAKWRRVKQASVARPAARGAMSYEIIMKCIEKRT